MKLKKIVSLALAGILAVSMLTACGEGTTDPTPNEPTEPTTAGFSSVFYDRLGEDEDYGEAAQVKISMADSAELTAKLTRAMEALSTPTILDFTTAIRQSGRTVASFDDTAQQYTTDNKVMPDLARIAVNMDSKDVNDAFASLVPTYNEAGKETVVMLWAVDINISENEAVNQVADVIVKNIASMEISDDVSSDDDKTTLHYSYNGSVSVATRQLVDNHGMGMRIVAVEITRTAKA